MYTLEERNQIDKDLRSLSNIMQDRSKIATRDELHRANTAFEDDVRRSKDYHTSNS